MKKKSLLMLVLLGIIAGSTFAQFSIGAGGYFTNDFGGGFEESNPDAKMEMPYMSGGIFAFFDVKYIQLSVGMLAFNNTTSEINNINSSTERKMYGMDIGLFGKIPLSIGKYFTLFPLLGVDYRLILTARDITAKDYNEGQYKNPAGKSAPWDFSAFWFKAGLGLDFSFNDTLFLRGEALYGVRLSSKYERDAVEKNSSRAALLGHGLTMRLALGYKLN